MTEDYATSGDPVLAPKGATSEPVAVDWRVCLQQANCVGCLMAEIIHLSYESHRGEMEAAMRRQRRKGLAAKPVFLK